MELTFSIQQDDYAFYIGKVPTCGICQTAYLMLQKLEPLFPKITFYEFNLNFAKDLVRNLEISNMPVFIISQKGVIKDVFYDFTFTKLALKLAKMEEE